MDRLEKRLAISYRASNLGTRKCRYREKWRWCCYREILARDVRNMGMDDAFTASANRSKVWVHTLMAVNKRDRSAEIAAYW
jgi:hypothetical protein